MSRSHNFTLSEDADTLRIRHEVTGPYQGASRFDVCLASPGLPERIDSQIVSAGFTMLELSV